MKILISTITSLSLMFSSLCSQAADQIYGQHLCQKPDYRCHTVKYGESWEKLFPQNIDRDIVKRINRMNIPLSAGTKIAIPKDLISMDKMDASPFHLTIAPQSERTIVVSLDKLAWAAYDKAGNQINWGPIAGGRDWCDDVDEPCETVTGEFYIHRAEGEECISKKYPVETRLREAGGAVMPYCMFFSGGYALHGSYNLPGYNASHGCVRLFTEDARWLYYEFIEIPGFNGGKERTRVIVE